jgi:hypothetical protein
LTVVITELIKMSLHAAILEDRISLVDLQGERGFHVNTAFFLAHLQLERPSAVAAFLAADGYMWSGLPPGNLSTGWECYVYEQRANRRLPVQCGIAA